MILVKFLSFKLYLFISYLIAPLEKCREGRPPLDAEDPRLEFPLSGLKPSKIKTIGMTAQFFELAR